MSRRRGGEGSGYLTVKASVISCLQRLPSMVLFPFDRLPHPSGQPIIDLLW